MGININKDLLKNIGMGVLLVIAIIVLILLCIHIDHNTCREIIYQRGIVVGQDHNVWYKDDTKHEEWETKVNTDTGEIFIDNSEFVYRHTALGQEVKVKKTEMYYKDRLVLTYYDVVID